MFCAAFTTVDQYGLLLCELLRNEFPDAPSDTESMVIPAEADGSVADQSFSDALIVDQFENNLMSE